jgi:hypothetical protein
MLRADVCHQLQIIDLTLKRAIGVSRGLQRYGSSSLPSGRIREGLWSRTMLSMSLHTFAYTRILQEFCGTIGSS